MSSKWNYNVESKKSAVELMNVKGYTLGALSEVYLLGDGAYDSDPLRRFFQNQGWVLLSPHRRGRIYSSNDGKKMRRYAKRWIVERTISGYTTTGDWSHAGSITQISSMSSSN